MTKLGICYELDDQGKDTGRVQVAAMDEETVYDTFGTEEEAEAALTKLQAESDREDKIKSEYLIWEEEVTAKYSISQRDIRVFLVNLVLC